MMKGKNSTGIKKIEPTRSELEILQVLWEYGPSPVRFVMEELNKKREMNYTAVLRLMQLMVDKGILQRDQSQMQHVYQVVEEENKTKEHLLDKFLDTLYKGSAASLIMQLVGKKKATKEEIKKIKALLNKMEKESGE